MNLDELLTKVANDASYDDWGEYMDDTHPHTQIEAAKRVCLISMIAENNSMLEMANTHMDERAQLVITLRIQELEKEIEKL